MSKIIQVERSIHYSMHDYHGKADFEKLTPMFLGYKIKHKLGLTGPFKRFNYVIHFLKKGNDIFIESGTQHNLVAGDAYIVKPHVPTYYLHENTEIEYAWIGFSGPYAKKLDDVNVVHHVKGNYFDSIKELVDQEETVYAEPVIEILLSAIGEILSSDSNSVIKDVKDYLDKYYYEPLQVETVARQFSYTRTYLSNVFKRQYGVTIKEYILNKRLSEALSLIINGTSVSDASEQVGFSNVYNFSRSFKAKYGVSPNNYLKKV
ncbi:MAG: helix-turn-helix domain-containing protein [Clostridia bacterium]|nr:helix-turn-helix domain-containing protein [Clostridia bacterium]